MVNDLELTIKRGQLLQETKAKSESLVNASERMLKTSKEAYRKAFWERHSKVVILGIVAVVLLILIYLIFFL